MVSVPLISRLTTAVVGSPGYFAENPPSTTPYDLARHRCIGCHSGPGGSLYRWEFEKDGTAIVMDVTGPLSTDDPDLMTSAALEGIGLWHGVEELARQAIADGRLIRVLADWSPSYPGFHIFATPPVSHWRRRFERWRTRSRRRPRHRHQHNGLIRTIRTGVGRGESRR